MMLQELFAKIDKNNLIVDKDMITKAYQFAKDAHKEQVRESGEPYFVHPVEVAEILVDMGLNTNAIVAGLLHDVIEDTEYTFEQVAEMFNKEVAILVDGVTKLGKIEFKSKEEEQADNIRKMLLAMTKDIRVILIKLADRLHNMRTLKYMPARKQVAKAKETFDIYAPLAHRLGMSKIKWELEDLAFRYINQEAYYDLVNKIAEKRVEREAYISEIMKDLNINLLGAGIKSDIDGRPKHFYSIYRKMVSQNKSIDQIFDLTAVRILVNSIKDCYAALGIVHTMYKPIPGRFKDYIAMPKPNMYQSLHSTVIGPQGKPFEIQIRTFEMHKVAEYGIAAHWKYKEGNKANNNAPSFDGKLSWLSDMLEWQRDTTDATEFMEAFKIDLFSDEVFVFTPNGKVIDLPLGSTPIDFAYRIHTDVGNRCAGAKVSSKMVPLDYKLNTGEIVEIITSSQAKGPSIDWLNIAKSNHAKAKIRLWFKKAKRDEHISKGKDLLEREAKKQETSFGDLIKGDQLQKTLKKYNFNTIEDLYVSVGSGLISSSHLVSKLHEAIQKNKIITNEEALKTVEEASKKINIRGKKCTSNGVIVKGVDNVLVRFAKCCSPVPGDEIIGYITKGRGVSVHRNDCTNATALLLEGEGKIVDVSWSGNTIPGVIAHLEIRAENRDGLLAEIILSMSEKKIQVDSINAKTVKNSEAVVNVQFRINDVNELKEIMKKFKKLSGVTEVYRAKS